MSGDIEHLVLRVPLVTQIDHRHSVSTIEAHADAARALGRVSVVKFGTAGTKGRADLLRQQIADGKKALLILVAKQKKEFVAQQAALAGIHYGAKTRQIEEAVPPYYREIGAEGGLWLTALAPFSIADLSKFTMASNGRPLLDVLGECRTSSMLVRRGSR